MCTSNGFPNSSLIPYGLKVQPGPAIGAAAPYPVGLPPGVATLELQRSQAAQLYDYGARLRLGIHYAAAAAAAAAGHHPGFGPYGPNTHDPFALMYAAKHCDPRIRFLHEEPKPSHSYIGLIAMAILSSKENKMVLSDIYQWILDNYAYFRSRGPGWRNSIRHNLSLNDCFVKAGRSANGKGHYWAIHPANMDDFRKGDFRRRRAQRKVRKAMGLAVPDDEDSPSPPPPPPPPDQQQQQQRQQQQQQRPPAAIHWTTRVLGEEDPEEGVKAGEGEEGGCSSPTADAEKKPTEGADDDDDGDGGESVPDRGAYGRRPDRDGADDPEGPGSPAARLAQPPPPKRRTFDVDSLLAPDSSRVSNRRCPDIRNPVSLSYYGRPFGVSIPHPNLLPPPPPPHSHLLQRDAIQNNNNNNNNNNNVQTHGATVTSGRRSRLDDPDESRTLGIDTTAADTDSENPDVTGPSSPENLSGTRDGAKDDDRVRDAESSSSGSADRRERLDPREIRALPSATWFPIPMIPGSWKDHASAFRSALPPGQRFFWGPIVSGTGQQPSGSALLRITPGTPR